jgi:hypothetical protein
MKNVDLYSINEWIYKIFFFFKIFFFNFLQKKKKKPKLLKF